MPRRETAEAEPQVEQRRHNPVQAKLFQTREIGRVVSIQPFQTRPAQPPNRAPRLVRGATATASLPGGLPGGLIELHQQSQFDFPSAAKTRRPAVDDYARLSRAPIAIPAHRVMAAILDFSLVLIAVGLVAIVLYTILGHDFLDGSTLSFFALMAGFFTLGYKLMWTLAGVESPGLRWTHLRLLTWDGAEPTREDRLRRLAWGCISLLPAGLGLLWSLVDEETLTWHDHSSKTFLTSFSEGAPSD